MTWWHGWAHFVMCILGAWAGMAIYRVFLRKHFLRWLERRMR